MVLCHEIAHLFGIKHCVYASCVMNGSNHLEESEAHPFASRRVQRPPLWGAARPSVSCDGSPPSGAGAFGSRPPRDRTSAGAAGMARCLRSARALPVFERGIGVET